MGLKIGEMIDAYKKNADIKPLRATLESVFPDNDRNEPVRRYDDASVIRLAEQTRRGVSKNLTACPHGGPGKNPSP